MSDLFMHRSADLSPCGHYRWTLERVWDKSRPLCGWIMLNPSTADAETDDPTIRRCIGFAHSWGFGGIVVANLFSYRCTEPRDLPEVLSVAIGPKAREPWVEVFDRCTQVMAAWGSHPTRFQEVAVRVMAMERGRRTVHALRINKDGQPAHPLYVPANTTPVVWFESPAEEVA